VVLHITSANCAKELPTANKATIINYTKYQQGGLLYRRNENAVAVLEV